MRLPTFVLSFVLFLSACAPAVPKVLPTETPQAVLELPTFPPTQVDLSGCQAVLAQPTPDSDAPSLFAKPGQGEYDHLRGPQTAPATIIVYSDFACPNCAPLAEILNRLADEYPDDLRLVFRHFPILTAYPNSGAAVRAVEAAGLQGKFWEMHNALFQDQAAWTELAEPVLGRYFASLAGQLGLDSAQFEADINSAAVADTPERAFSSGLEIGLPGSPLLLINGQIYTGPINYGSLKFIVGMIVLGQHQFATCPEMVIDPAKRYYATLKTEKGDIVLRLYADLAPVTVNSFVFLAQNGWYDDITFHRVIPGFMAQTGDPSGTGAGNPGYFIINETASGLKFDRAGLLGMANTGPDTTGSQFFITLGPAPHLDGGYTIFGEVVSGFEVAEKLAARDALPGQDVPAGDRLITVIIEER